MWAQDQDGTYWYPGDRRFVMMYGGTHPMVTVVLTEDPDGPYYGWIRAGEVLPIMIYPNEDLFSMCFPYGYRGEEERGRGEMVRMRAEVATALPGDKPEVLERPAGGR
jgi:hypothetical protein